MRWLALALLVLFLVGCAPQGKGIVTDATKDKAETQKLVGNAISGDYDLMGKPCSEDMQCGLGRVCINQTCAPKKR
jgi:hypothetical protein